MSVATPARVRVRVTQGGEPLSGATVRIRRKGQFDSARATQTTDAQGFAHFPGVERDSWVIEILAEGWCAQAQEVDLQDLDSTEIESAHEIDLEKGVPFEGRVLDSRTREPVRGAQVFITDDLIEVASTDAEGRFRVPGARDADFHWLWVRAPGYCVGDLPVFVDAGSLRAGEDPILLEPAGSLSGRVVSRLGVPVPGALVIAVAPEMGEKEFEEPVDPGDALDPFMYRGEPMRAPQAMTAADGTFRLEGLKGGVGYKVAADANGHGASECTITRWTRRTAGQALSIVLRRSVTLVVVVRDPDGRIVSDGVDIDVRQWTADRLPITVSPGTFRFRDLDPGPATLRVRVTGYPRANEKILLRDGATELRDVTLLRSATVEGLVTDVEGRPAAGAFVQVRSETHYGDVVQTNEHGQFSAGGFPAGAVSVLAGHPSGTKLLEPLQVIAPSSGVRVVLRSPESAQRGSIRMRLLTPEGTPFVGKLHLEGGGTSAGPREGCSTRRVRSQ